MARFMRAIHLGQAAPAIKMDGPDKPGHDEKWSAVSESNACSNSKSDL